MLNTYNYQQNITTANNKDYNIMFITYAQLYTVTIDFIRQL